MGKCCKKEKDEKPADAKSAGKSCCKPAAKAKPKK